MNIGGDGLSIQWMVNRELRLLGSTPASMNLSTALVTARVSLGKLVPGERPDKVWSYRSFPYENIIHERTCLHMLLRYVWMMQIQVWMGQRGLKLFELVEAVENAFDRIVLAVWMLMWSNAFEQMLKSTYCKLTKLILKHFGNRRKWRRK